jgi:hypothetical protein
MKIPEAEWQARHSQPREIQLESFDTAILHKSSVEAKLFPEWQGKRAASFARCGHEKLYRECRECGTTTEFEYHCNLKWCPSCNWRVTHKRSMELRLITAGIPNLKHAVLTQRNFGHLTREHIVATRKNLASLRRSKLFKSVLGGCCSLEFTNESKGWHMHWHLLLQSQYIPIEDLKLKWGKLVGQEYAICDIGVVKGNDYIREVTKYVVKGAEIARWPRETVLEFVNALDSTRLFSIYGTWKEKRAAAKLQMQRDAPMPTCECGCTHFLYGDDETFVTRDIRRDARR